MRENKLDRDPEEERARGSVVEDGAQLCPALKPEHGLLAEDREQLDQTAKVTITRKVEALMTVLLAKVNDGFEFGRLNRQQLISWILAKFADDCSDTEIRAIRADHFDELALLELSIKRFKQGGGLPPELKKLLLAQAGLDDKHLPAQAGINEMPRGKRAKAI